MSNLKVSFGDCMSSLASPWSLSRSLNKFVASTKAMLYYLFIPSWFTCRVALMLLLQARASACISTRHLPKQRGCPNVSLSCQDRMTRCKNLDINRSIFGCLALQASPNNQLTSPDVISPLFKIKSITNSQCDNFDRKVSIDWVAAEKWLDEKACTLMGRFNKERTLKYYVHSFW